MQGHKPAKARQGFTLIELTITLAVIVIVTGGVFLTFRQPNRRALENASLQLQADIRYAQRRAMIGGRQFDVLFEPAHNRYRVRYLNPIQDIRVVYFTDGVQLRYSTLPRLIFHPRGTPNRGFTITLSNGRYWQDLTVTVSGGRVRIFDATD